ncbi:alpha/beta fold hydrolase [Streptomyces sp. NBC_00663]|uniref:esterase/lipase family protein n=1 Tax=Streptomyces sp. NBC_00663 TaxID=2975801 RepID=UPI002E3577C3|nr:alpha/beta fold hydrolase [Streptomyces sp. NBC_00663]
MAERKVAVVFLHGLFSGPKTWENLQRLLESDRDIHRSEVQIDFKRFPYDSPKFKINPLRRIPNLNDIADSLKSYLEIECDDYDALILISHSQGGLVLQRYLQRMLNDGRGLDLNRIKKAVMFACPNSGSELFLLARRWIFFLFRHSQAKELGTLNDSIAEAQRKVIHSVVRSITCAPNECRIPITAYFGQTDNIVRPTSAMGLFLDTGSMPGDHFTIIQPENKEALVYKTVKKHVLDICRDLVSLLTTPTTPDSDPELPFSPDRNVEQRWAFAWTADDPSDDLASAIARAVDFVQSTDRAAPFFSLRVDNSAKPANREYGRPAISEVVQKSRISIIISDDLARSFHCLHLFRAAVEAEKKVYVLSQREISNESKMEILAAGDRAEVETFVYEPSKLQEEVSRILLKAGPKTDWLEGASDSKEIWAGGN